MDVKYVGRNLVILAEKVLTVGRLHEAQKIRGAGPEGQ
jgi:hypothetical protein